MSNKEITINTDKSGNSPDSTNSVELTRAGQKYVPLADIFETEKELTVVLDMPGVSKDGVQVNLEENRLDIEGILNIDSSLKNVSPAYTEYNVGHYHRRFIVSNRIDRAGIGATMKDGVLTLRLPKVPEATPRRIQVT